MKEVWRCEEGVLLWTSVLGKITLGTEEGVEGCQRSCYHVVCAVRLYLSYAA
jgi:hypothetical protein